MARGRTGGTAGDGAPLLVLLVEDEPLIAMTMVEVIEELGHAVVEASTGAAALALLDARPDVALLVSDIGLPDMDGDALRARARDLHPALPVVFVTGHAGRAALARPDARPPTLVVLKPFSGDDLRRAIDGAVGLALAP